MYIPKNNSNTIYHTHLPMYQTNHATTKKKRTHHRYQQVSTALENQPSTLHPKPKISKQSLPHASTAQTAQICAHSSYITPGALTRARPHYTLSPAYLIARFSPAFSLSPEAPLSLSLSLTHTETRLRCAKIAPLQIALLCSLRKRRLRDTVTSRRHRRAREKSPSPIVSGPRVDGFSERRKQGAVVSRWGLEGANPGPEQKELAPAYITQ